MDKILGISEEEYLRLRKCLPVKSSFLEKHIKKVAIVFKEFLLEQNKLQDSKKDLDPLEIFKKYIPLCKNRADIYSNTINLHPDEIKKFFQLLSEENNEDFQILK